MGRVARTLKSVGGTSPYFAPRQPLPDYIKPGVDAPTLRAPLQRTADLLTQHFYKCLYDAHITTEKLNYMDDEKFPYLEPYKLGLTNLVHRPTAKSEQLSRTELERGVPELLQKIKRYQPRVVCFVGKQIGDIFLRVVRKQGWIDKEVSIPLPKQVAGFWHSVPGLVPKADLGYGVLPFCMRHSDTSSTLFYVTPSTSARVTHHLLPGKTRLFAHIPTLLRPPEADWQPVKIPCMRESWGV